MSDKILVLKDKLKRWLKPPDPVYNSEKKKLMNLINKYLKNNGKVIDLGGGNRELAKGILNFDICMDDNVNILGDAHLLPFKNETLDFVISTALLEHVKRPRIIVNEILRTLKKQGIVYVQVPFLQGYHADPHDYYRFTIEGIQELFCDFEMIEKGVCVGPISVLVWYLRKFPTIFFKNYFINKAIEFVTGWLLFWLCYVDIFFIKAKNAHVLASGIYYIGKKN